MRALLAVLLVVAGLLGSGGALADATGQALGVNQDAKADTKAGMKVLQVGSDIFIGDRVVTNGSGQVQIRFSDSTKLVVGPNSALLIEDYLLRNDGSGGKFAVNALKGTFRFVTGKAPKDRYLIETPTGTIGVRGTAFDFTVLPTYYAVLLYEGITRICSSSSRCATMDDFCEVGVVDNANAVTRGATPQMTTELRNQARQLFPYAINDSSLLPAFRIAQSDNCFDRLARQPAEQGGGGNADGSGGVINEGGGGVRVPPDLTHL